MARSSRGQRRRLVQQHRARLRARSAFTARRVPASLWTDLEKQIDEVIADGRRQGRHRRRTRARQDTADRRCDLCQRQPGLAGPLVWRGADDRRLDQGRAKPGRAASRRSRRSRCSRRRGSGSTSGARSPAISSRTPARRRKSAHDPHAFAVLAFMLTGAPSRRRRRP